MLGGPPKGIGPMKVPFAKIVDCRFYETNEEPCHICGRPVRTDRKFHAIEMTFDHDLVERDEDNDQSQGLFPVGSECIKKIPEKYRHTFRANKD